VGQAIRIVNKPIGKLNFTLRCSRRTSPVDLGGSVYAGEFMMNMIMIPGTCDTMTSAPAAKKPKRLSRALRVFVLLGLLFGLMF